ncbi:glutaredoxin family protein [Lentibacillus amyloliquefaciens]|uniref:NrdH-redoxin n=1 Tax=Lentibacillus amyloliquefaciens TaxID=1472767 RepID=A0A0U4F8M6_9BACI|nr:glutaredoxin domain-containing protein [Lentibacillus amyloliquefaciens]ALX49155.1 NrdH-redoxin [Lentibacillus amyloliquefaciens]
MSDQEVIVYTSENSEQCQSLLGKLNQWDIDYKQRNVTENREYLNELQEEGIYGTPATFVNKKVVLGNQVNKIKHALGMMDNYQSYSSFSK